MTDLKSVSLYADAPACSQEDIEKSIRKKFKHDLEGKFEKAVVAYDLIEEGDLLLSVSPAARTPC